MVLLKPVAARTAIVFPLLGLLLAGCGRPQSATPYDPDLLAEIRQIKAFDNHAHPVLAPIAGRKPDRDFDALPVDNMEPSSDPPILRPHNPLVEEAARALYGG